MKLFAAILSVAVAGLSLTAQGTPRARDLGIPFDGTPGPLNAITDVRGVEQPIEPEARTASALIFDPPVAAGFPPLELSRAEREPAAFVAYDEVFSTYFYVRMDDRQKIAADGRSERRVISETFGISRR